MIRGCLLAIALGAAAPAGAAPPPDAAAGKEVTVMSFQIRSPAFEHGKPIPAKFTCDGEDLSPELTWSGAPEGTRSFTLILDDPDAPVGTWDHWIVIDLPGDCSRLTEGIASLPGKAVAGRNGWRRSDYGGPCPPGGKHRYFFRLYALDGMLGLPAGAAKADVLKAMKGHVLAEAELMGTYAR
jgi:hypothetical protein